MQQAIDNIIGKTASVGLVWLGAAALLAVIGEAGFSALRQRFLIRLAELFDRRVYRVMSLHLLRARCFRSVGKERSVGGSSSLMLLVPCDSTASWRDVARSARECGSLTGVEVTAPISRLGYPF